MVVRWIAIYLVMLLEEIEGDVYLAEEGLC